MWIWLSKSGGEQCFWHGQIQCHWLLGHYTSSFMWLSPFPPKKFILFILFHSAPPFHIQIIWSWYANSACFCSDCLAAAHPLPSHLLHQRLICCTYLALLSLFWFFFFQPECRAVTKSEGAQETCTGVFTPPPGLHGEGLLVQRQCFVKIISWPRLRGIPERAHAVFVCLGKASCLYCPLSSL